VKSVYFGDLIKDTESDGKQDELICAYSDLQPDYSIWRNRLRLLLNNLVKTNQNVKHVVLNREDFYGITFGSYTLGNQDVQKSETAKSKRKAKSFYTFEMEETDFKAYSSILKDDKPLDFVTAASQLNDLNMTLNRVMLKSEYPSATFESSHDRSIRGIFDDLNDCIRGMINEMPVDFNDFDMQKWLESYKCALRMYIETMKFLADETTTRTQLGIVYMLLIMMCVMFRVIRFFTIYPYITIRILYNTVQERIEKLENSLRFSEFLKNHPGMDHKTGVAPGQTFILVYLREQIINDENKLNDFNESIFRQRARGLSNDFPWDDIDFPDTPVDQQIIDEVSKLVDMVVADFTIPFICCDDCSNLPHTPVTLDPLATPICGIAQVTAEDGEDEDELSWDYQPVNIRILNDVYDPAIYKVRIPEGVNPSYGNHLFEDGVYDPDPGNKTAQILKYEVNEYKLSQAMPNFPGEYFIIDEFAYEIYKIENTNREVVIDSSTICIFIPILPATEKQTGSVRGQVTSNEEPVPGASIYVKDSALGTTTLLEGNYQLSDVPVGERVLVVSYVGYDTKEISIEIIANQEVIANIDLEYAPILEIDFGRIYGVMELQPDSEAASKIRSYYNTNMSDYKRKVKEIEKQEGNYKVTVISKVKTSIEMYANEKDISVVKLNNDFNRKRNELIEEWDKAPRKKKRLYKELLQNLTRAYLDRLAYVQPRELSETTDNTLKETASICNKRSELGMKEVLAKWNSGAKGYITEDFRENVGNSLKLK